MRFVLASALATLLVTGGLTPSARLNAQPLPELVAPTGPLPPADERKALVVPAGFEVQLVASEPDIQKPMQMAFDAKGRLWVTTSYHYPFAAPAGKGTDKLFVLSDFDENGKAKKVQTFAADLNIPIGILPLPDCNSCIVSSVGEILKLTDTDGDGKYDKREVLFTGFGSRDTHGMYNSYTLMPDGWVYACHGFNNDSTVKGKDGHEVKMQSGNTFRFRPDGSRIEVFSRGQVNPFGMTVDPWFNLYTADCHSKPMTQNIPGAVYESFGKPHDGLGFGPVMFGYDPGGTGLCGLAWYDADHFPKEYKGMMFLGNVVTSRVNLSKIEWTGSTPRAVQQPDFVVSKDPWFRPVDLKLGPDGALYVSDFYNKIIGHYEVDLKHPQRDKDRGRLWRIVWKGKGEPGASATGETAPKMAYTDLTKEKLPRLVELLEHPNLAVRLAATNQLARYGKAGIEAFPQGNYPKREWVWEHPRVYATYLMLAEQAGIADEDLHANFAALPLLTWDNPVRQELAAGIARGLGARPKWGETARQIVTAMLKVDPEPGSVRPRIRRAFVEAVATHPHPDFVKPLIEVIQKCPAGDTHLLHAARIALRNQLRDTETGWQPFSEPVKVPADQIAILVDVSFGIPNAASADFLGKVIAADRLPDDRQLAAAEHIGRYGTGGNRFVVFKTLVDRPAGVKGFPVLQSLIRGVQTSGQRVEPAEVVRILGRVMKELESGNNPSRLTALRVLAELPPVVPRGFTIGKDGGPDPFPTILRFIGDTREPDELRGTALETLTRLDAKQGYTNAETHIDSPQTTPGLRERAAILLAASADRNHKQAAKDAIQSVPYRSAVVIATALASTTAGGEILLEAVKQGKAPARLLQERPILDRLRAANVPNLNKQIADLTKGLQPADQKIAELIKQRGAKLPAAKVDLELGAKLYEKHCAACHQIGGKGNKIGPQLDGIGLRGAERLLEDTLDPNRNVDAAFRARVLLMKDGTSKSGLMLRIEGEVLVMADDQGKEFRVPTKDIETNRETALSPMPANFGEVIPEADFYHLMGYLLDQKVKELPPKK